MAVAKDTQQFCVRWNSYQSNLQSAFPKLLTSEHFVDVTLACESRMVKCHKLVLSACSAYFEKLLVQNPCPHPIIFMKDMKYWEVQALVDFMYKGEVNVTQEELGTLLKAAEALEVRGLCGQQEQGLADKLALPRDTVMAGDNSAQKKRRTDSEANEEKSMHVNKVELGTVPTNTSHVPKSPNTQEQSKNIQTPTSTSSMNVKQEVNVADNGLFDDLDDDFYQDDNSLQIDETGSAYSLPGPSGQPPLDNSPASALIYCQTAYGSTTTLDVKEEIFEDSLRDNSVNEQFRVGNLVKDESSSMTTTNSDEAFNNIGYWDENQKDCEGSDSNSLRIFNYSKKSLKAGKRRHLNVYRSAAQDLLRGQTLLAVSATYRIPRSTLHDYMKKSGLLPAWRESRCSSKQKPSQ